ncbi:bifunctional diguanylate cyclase/phosphodiesterase [Blastococcus sp. LR1]|uniref:putative bifunctional diguanylate cyclase/phosphodiesterase n=1 Tax=Blastococcus sp. LR1 TaxID=2877000 RepID=UPI001CD00487|nr:bifunctional diguanylate cyclase/phosphodiesterase [Blastococcus sp. LR1]MCA0144421.1 bifunctional diguanylate cyclase/phosphodiesterase [Blastococcus sp. LR1]
MTVGSSRLAPLRRRVLREALAVVTLTVLFGVAAVVWDLPERLTGPVAHVVLLLAFSHLLMMVFGKRRSDDLKAEYLSRDAAERDLLHRARHDDLTGLLNRSALLEELSRAREAGPVPVLLIDLDRFKDVNDVLGHSIGDALLVRIAGRLRSELPVDAVLGRLGGDEFAVLLPGRGQADAERVAEQALAVVGRPVTVEGTVLELEGSCGVAIEGDTAADLLRHADVAVYAAKEEHAGVTVYRPSMDADSRAQLTLIADLRRAIRDGELVVHYQPRVRLSDGRTLGVEALVRWQHPVRGLVPPSEFIPVAEQTGLIGPLTDAVLGNALAACRRWREAGLDLTVAVNLSVRGLFDAGLADRIATLLRDLDLPASCLELEITESVAMRDPGRALEVLHRLRDTGIALSVDDYGTGHASLAYLTRLPVGTLKIDRSFVQTMELDASDRTIVRSTIELAHGLGLRVVAEGVETRAAWDDLGRLGCDDAQGYWLARPQPFEDVAPCVAALEERLAVSRTS